MNRTGTALLTGTFALSVWLAPAGRLYQDVGQTQGGTLGGQTRGGASNQGALHKTSESVKHDLDEAQLSEIKREAKDVFSKAIQRVIVHACETHDYQIPRKTDKEYEQELQKQELQDDKKSESKKCLDPRNFIIASVPDPLHTHLALVFDRTIDAIEEAAQDKGYIFDRAIMPWDPKIHTESTDYETRKKEEWYQRGLEELPGIMVFRSARPKQNEPLFVIVVGETPTSGIHQRQFFNAIKIIETATGRNLRSRKSWHPDGEAEPGLRIVGPNFSGSLDSLTKLLTCNDNGKPIGCYPLVSIHSGTVSNRDTILRFDSENQAQDIHFVSFQESDYVAIERLTEFLTGTRFEAPLLSPPQKLWQILSRWFSAAPESEYSCGPTVKCSDRGYKTHDIAILSEDETAYGAGESSSRSEGRQKGNDDILKLYFPREISQLRAAYQDKATPAPTTGEGRTPPRETLPSDYYVPGGNEDTVAGYSARQMPLSQESLMLNIVAELQRHQTKFIILRATDPMDTIFLTRFLRTEYPHGRVVTTGSDLLLRREAEDPRFHGVLSLSTYFLYPTADHYFKSFEEGHVERIFANSDTAGTYNAMRSVLDAWVNDTVCKDGFCGRHELVVHPKPPCPGWNTYPSLYQYGWLGEWDKRANEHPRTVYNAPPVRLSVLGRDDFWPIAALGPFQGEEQTMLPIVKGQISEEKPQPKEEQQQSKEKPQPEGDKPRLKEVKVPSSWRIVQLAGIFLALGFALSIWRASVRAKTQMDSKFAPAQLYGRAFLVLLAGLTLILILLILRWPTVGVAERIWYLDYGLEATAALVFVVTFVDLLNRLILAYRVGGKLPFWRRRKQPFWKLRNLRYWRRRSLLYWRRSNMLLLMGWVWLIVLGVGAPILAFHVFLNQPIETPAAVVRLATIRVVQLNSGLSFIMPTFFFLTVWLWWSYHTAAGYALLDYRRPRIPKGMTVPSVERLSKKALTGLHAAVHPKPATVLGYLALLAFVFVVFWTMGSDPTPLLTLERPFLQGVMAFLFTAALGGMIVATARLWGIWLATRKLLVALDALPIRRGFDGVIKDMSWHPIWRIGAGSVDEQQRMIARQREALICALNTRRLDTGKLNAAWESTLMKWEATKIEHGFLWPTRWWARRKAEVDLIKQFGEYQEQLSELGGRALDYVAKTWDDQKEERKRSSYERLGEFLRSTEKRRLYDRRQSGTNPDEQLGVHAWEHFVCLLYVAFLLVMLVRIRTLTIAIGGMYVLTMIAITQYPFQPKAEIQVLLVVLLGYIVTVVGVAFAQIYRDAILSRITGTNPGELGLDFYVRMVSFTALPLFSLLAAQFPSVNRFFYSWLQPAIQAVNK